MTTRDEAQRLIEKILSYSKFPACEVSVREPEEAYVRFANNGVTTAGFSVERTISIESSREGRTGVTSLTEIDDAALRAAVARSEEIAAITPPNPERVEPLGPQEYPKLDKYDPETAAARAPSLIPHIKAIIDPAADKKLVAAGFFRRTASAMAAGNKKGRFGYHRGADSRLSTTVRRPDGSSSGWDGQASLRIREINGVALANRAIDKCLKWDKPRRLDPGKYTVVLEATATADLLYMMGFSMSARSAEEGRSFLAKKGGGTLLGEKLFPESVTIRSDPFDARLPAMPWGQGGLPSGRMTWVEKGVIKNLYYDRYWAMKKGKEPTPFPANVVVEGGDASLEDLVRSVDRGLLVTRFWYIRFVNFQTLQLTGLTRDGLFLIEKGQVTAPVMNFRFNESPVRMLQNVKMLGRPVRTVGSEGGSMVAPPLVAAEFMFSSVSDAV